MDVLYEPVSNEVSYTLAWPISFPGKLADPGCVVLVLWSLKGIKLNYAEEEQNINGEISRSTYWWV